MIAAAELQTLLLELVVLFGLCIVVSVVFHRLRIPPIVGFLTAGALVGPYGFGLVKHPELVEPLAEIGVIALLFTVGLELSLPQLLRLKRMVFVAGGLQLLLTISLGALAASLGLPPGRAMFLGFMLTLSSTAAITKLLSDRGEIRTPAGRVSVSVCIAQDLAVVPMILALPLLAGGGETGLWHAVIQVSTSFGVLLVTAIVAWVVFPPVLGLVSRTRSRELFVLGVLTLCLSVTLVTGALGLSLALGAFLAGVILGASDYHHQAVSEVEPFRDALGSLFFVSIGMLFDYHTILAAPLLVLGALWTVIVGKAAIAYVAVRALRMPHWIAFRSGLMLAQVGEFSFVLAQVAGAHELVSPRHQKVFLVVAVLSIAATPLLFAFGRLAGRRPRAEGTPQKDASSEVSDHVVLVGFGPSGESLAGALDELDIPYRAIEMNPETVRAKKAEGVPIEFGDSTRAHVLRSAGIDRARLLVIAINDAEATRRAAALARRYAPNVHILARSEYLGEVDALRAAGADEIVPQELETTAEIMVRALRHYLVPDDVVGRHVREIRERGHGIKKVATKADVDGGRLSQHVPGLYLRVFHVENGSAVAEKTIAESDLRRQAGVHVIAIQRAGAIVLSIDPLQVFSPGDVVVVVGTQGGVESAGAMFRGPSSLKEDLVAKD